MPTSRLKGAHFSVKRCALLSLELTTPRQPPCATNHPFVAQRSIFCCAREHLLLRNKISTPPNLRTSKSPSNESKKTFRTSRTRMFVHPYGVRLRRIYPPICFAHLRRILREPKPMPRAAAKGLAALPTLSFHSRTPTQNSNSKTLSTNLHRSAQINL